MQAHLFRFRTIAICLAGSAAVTFADPGASKSSRPRYLDMSYEAGVSDFTDGPTSASGGPLAAYKNVQLDDDWSVSLGGQFRYRFESENDKALAAPKSHDSFHLFRYLINTDFTYRDSLRIFVEVIGAFDEDRSLGTRGTDENHWDLQQFFIDTNLDLAGQPWTIRVGRQKLEYGSGRFVSSNEWDNIQRRFDGVKLFTSGDTWDLDLWWAKPVGLAEVAINPKQRDRANEDINFYGIYATYKAIQDHGLDLYFLALTDSGNMVNPNGNAGDRNVYTLGSRFWGHTNEWDYETELAGQWGHWSGDTLQAWSWSALAGYTFEDWAGKPRLGVGFDIATGDRSANDSSVQTFTSLFPNDHRFFGYLDLIGRENMTSSNVNLSAWAVPDKVKATLAFQTFWLTSRKDALYGAGTGPVLRDTEGDSGRKVANELDATIHWKVDETSDVLVGWSHLFDREFIQQTSPGETVDLFYLQYKYTF